MFDDTEQLCGYSQCSHVRGGDAHDDKRGAGTLNLSELILWRKNQLKLSWRDLAGRAEHAGRQLSSARLSELGNNRPPLTDLPNVSTLHAIASAIDVHVELVLQSAAETLGLTISTPDAEHRADEGVARLIAVVRGATDAELDLIARSAQIIREAKGGGHAE